MVLPRWARALVAVALLCSCGGCGSSASPDDADDPGSSVRHHPRTSTSSLSFDPPPLPAVPAGTPPLRVLTFNINFGVGEDPRNVAAVAEADADLVLLQETTLASEQAFRQVLADRYPHMLFRECCNAGGLGVMSKYPIAEEQYLEPTVGWFPAWRVVIDAPLGPVQVLDVHLRPPMSDGGSWVAGYFSTRDVRRDEMAAFWVAMDPSMPTIVAGDFNEDAEGKAIAYLAEQGLHSALPQVAPKAKTWRWPTRMGELRMMLDHVVYGAGLQLHAAEVMDRGTSDHQPVLVVLSAAEPVAAR
ncbi:endonuclease/exonuclease/phosphatase family protein [Paraliomyxa miuraensis]|uniref:endonuclease/exonuclease/phosphatase family protein n=1 Tax=Paraliomyxa miuraensis TaxID=376150 RepID=UPI0022545599|nr:endonuclease/exonuclease/phosphatase family protein [Paraliomyxa miuraensis]MCX4239459.1 endonuclease/exonuclease/phosphatase family protein [Paraliomyxa miuraensis]